jgi:hypothetical protein
MISPVKRLLLVSHRPIDQAGGPAARWRLFARHLPEDGWEADVVSVGDGDEFAAPERAGLGRVLRALFSPLKDLRIDRCAPPTTSRSRPARSRALTGDALGWNLVVRVKA